MVIDVVVMSGHVDVKYLFYKCLVPVRFFWSFFAIFPQVFPIINP
jgi:hypothetical protein